MIHESTLSPSQAIRTLDSMGIEDYILLQGADGDLIVLLEPLVEPDERANEEHDRVFFTVEEPDESGEPALVLRPL